MTHANAIDPAVLQELAKPSPAYKRRVWVAVAGLTLFVVLYFVLAGWFMWTAYRLTVGAAQTTFVGYLVGGSAFFLAIFMLKAVVGVKRGGTQGSIEITAAEQPRLFEFLNQLADSAGAPRPHKVFLSAHVNAGVFYDLSALNLLFPSKKNLEIGLGLVNGLTLGEFRAVLAHEFGHFSQSAMAVGRWTYVAQHIAADLVTRRDKLDDFLERLARFDLRVAWIGWILKVVVWSIRSLVDSAFHLLVLTHRALSRQMEFNADLVAVSLTGSDALMHALHRLQAADDSWQRTLRFASGELARERIPRDVFAVQSRLMERMGEILNDPDYAKVPSLPADRPAEHRLFKPELAQPPQMWLTHPLNHEREANAKQRYVPASIDERSAWTLFDKAESAREQVSAALLQSAGKETVPVEQTLDALNEQFAREFLHSRYRGVYLGRSVVRGAATAEDLVGSPAENWRAELEALYPPRLTADVGRHRQLENELGQLRALQSGVLKPSEGVIRHRGRTIKPTDLSHVIEQVDREAASIEDSLRAADRQCRSVHLAAARHVGRGWEDYLRGVLAVLHFADHTHANLRDLRGMLGNAVGVATVTGRVSSQGRNKVIEAANALHAALMDVVRNAAVVRLDPKLQERLGISSWEESFGKFELPPATEDNIGEWLNVVDGWVEPPAASLSALSSAALDHLLATEAFIAEHGRKGTSPEQAPPPSRVPSRYETLPVGKERKRQTKLGWWDRFQVADGIVPATARIAAAAAIVIAVLGFGETVGNATITVYNGLQRTVYVSVDGVETTLAPLAMHKVQLEAGDHRIWTRTADGRVIEEMTQAVPGSFAKFIYNVAGAAPLVQWTAVYGNARPQPPVMLGAPVWIRTSVEYVFDTPPERMSSRSGGASVQVISGWAEASPGSQLSVLQTEEERGRLVAAHARWDHTTSPHAERWLRMAHRFGPNFSDILSARLIETPDDIELLRLEQDAADSLERTSVCARHTARSVAAPDNADLSYLATRCISDSTVRHRRFADGYRKWPTSGWYAYAIARGHLENAQWKDAFEALEQVRRHVPSQRHDAVVDMARIYRLLHAHANVEADGAPGPRLQALITPDSTDVLRALSRQSDELRELLEAESRTGTIGNAHSAYAELARGNLDRALTIASADSDVEARVLRLAAASDGTTKAILTRARALDPKAGLDGDTWWTNVALAARDRGDVDAALAALNVAPEYSSSLRRFVNLVREAKVAAAERQLIGLQPWARAQGYAVGVVMLGGKAPKAWRHQAKRLLFASERPFFR
jgi:Zn-dependent protease with chaperone function